MGRVAGLQREDSVAMALVKNGGGSYSPPGVHNLEHADHNQHPRNSGNGKTTPFSISAILSEDVGRKRPLSSVTSGVREKKPRLLDSGPGMEGGGSSPVGLEGGAISLSQAGSLVLSPRQISYPGVQGYSPSMSMAHGGVTSATTPAQIRHALTPQQSLNNSLSTSPFNTSILSALGHQQSPGPQEDVFTDSLGILSTVALYHSELSSLSEGDTSVPVHERVEAMRLTSGSEHQEASHTMLSCSSSESMVDRKAGTPYILKKDKRRRRQSSGGSLSEAGHKSQVPTEEPATHLNTGFLSPTSADATFHQQLTFSPSIFLRRPPDTATTSLLSTADHSSMGASVLTTSPCADGEYPAGVSDGASASSSFSTSTPIKENTQSSSSSALVGRTPSQSRMRAHHEVSSSSSSDSEVPIRRARRIPKKSRARTKLSPLLENACSPISKSHLPQPSSLLSTNFAWTPSRIFPLQPPLSTTSQGYNPQLSAIQDTSNHQPSVDAASRVTYLPAERMVCSSAATNSQTYLPYFHPCAVPQQHLFPQYHPMSQNLMAASGSKWMGSPVMSQWDHHGQIQCVPPRFIFAQNQMEGKRSRLTEAINRSLSETPSENPKLPAEWTKYACGQTADQKDLTEKAKTFLQCRPRQLTFEGMS